MGLPALPGCLPDNLQSLIPEPFFYEDGPPIPNHLIGNMAGNGQNAPVLSSILAYLVTHLVPIEDDNI